MAHGRAGVGRDRRSFNRVDLSGAGRGGEKAEHARPGADVEDDAVSPHGVPEACQEGAVPDRVGQHGLVHGHRIVDFQAHAGLSPRRS
jgi:hypothetical protein